MRCGDEVQDQCCHCRLGASNVHVRARAIAQQLARIAAGRARGAKALVVRAGVDGCTGCQCGSPDRYLDSMRIVYSALPADWLMLVERQPGAAAGWAAEVGSRVRLFGAAGPRSPALHGLKLLVSQTYSRIVL